MNKIRNGSSKKPNSEHLWNQSVFCKYYANCILCSAASNILAQRWQISQLLLSNEKICREISEHKIAVCEKAADLRSGNSSDLSSACLKVLVPVKIFQFSDIHYESEQYRGTTDGLNIEYSIKWKILKRAESYRILCIYKM